MDELEDEFHHLFICNDTVIKEAISRFISKYFRVRPSIYKFVDLMYSMSENRKLAIDLAKFLKCTKIVYYAISIG